MNTWYSITPSNPTTGFNVTTQAYDGTTERTENLQAQKRVDGADVVTPINFTLRQGGKSSRTYTVRFHLIEVDNCTFDGRLDLPARNITLKAKTNNGLEFSYVFRQNQGVITSGGTETTGSTSSTLLSQEITFSRISFMVEPVDDDELSFELRGKGGTTYRIEQGYNRISGSSNANFSSTTNVETEINLSSQEQSVKFNDGEIDVYLTIKYDLPRTTYATEPVNLGEVKLKITIPTGPQQNVNIHSEDGTTATTTIPNYIDVRMCYVNASGRDFSSSITDNNEKTFFGFRFPRIEIDSDEPEVTEEVVLSNAKFNWPKKQDVKVNGIRVLIFYGGVPLYYYQEQSTNHNVENPKTLCKDFDSATFGIMRRVDANNMWSKSGIEFSSGTTKSINGNFSTEFGTEFFADKNFDIDLYGIAIQVPQTPTNGGTITPTEQSPIGYNTVNIDDNTTVTTAVIPATGIDCNTLESWGYQINKANLNQDELEELFSGMTQIIMEDVGAYEQMEPYNP